MISFAKQRHHAMTMTIMVMIVTVTSACNNKFSSLSAHELSEKADQCAANSAPSPGFAITCDNVRKECKRRREDNLFHC